MALTEKLLGQARPANTTAASIYSPPANTSTIIRAIVIANTTGSSAKFSLYHDDDGTAVSGDEKLYEDNAVGANDHTVLFGYYAMNDSSGNFSVQTDTPDALTFSVFGIEATATGSQTHKMLGQNKPANTTATSLFTPTTNSTSIVRTVLVCNTSAGAVTFRLFIDEDGTTYDETTALMYDYSLAVDTTYAMDTYLVVASGGNFGIRTGTSNALTFTCYGMEIT